MKSFSSEYSFTDTKDYKAGQLDSYNFPAKLKLYDDGTVEYLCNTGEVIREKSKGNIYDNFVNFINGNKIATEDDYARVIVTPIKLEADLSLTKNVVRDNTSPLVGASISFEIKTFFNLS